MYREFKIKDAESKEIIFRCYPTHQKPNFMVVEKDEMGLGFTTREALLQMVKWVSTFMSGNSINELEVKEIEE